MSGGQASRQPPTMQQQADFIEYLINRCRRASGDVADETWMRLTADEAEDLAHIARRLERMAAHETAIKKIVTGR